MLESQFLRTLPSPTSCALTQRVACAIVRTLGQHSLYRSWYRMARRPMQRAAQNAGTCRRVAKLVGTL